MCPQHQWANTATEKRGRPIRPRRRSESSIFQMKNQDDLSALPPCSPTWSIEQHDILLKKFPPFGCVWLRMDAPRAPSPTSPGLLRRLGQRYNPTQTTYIPAQPSIKLWPCNRYRSICLPVVCCYVLSVPNAAIPSKPNNAFGTLYKVDMLATIQFPGR